LFCSSPASTALAGLPRIRFDAAPLVGCRDVTTDEFRAMHPDERLMEAKFTVSSLIVHGDEDDLVQYFYRFDSPLRTVQVIDQLPNTTVASPIAGNVGVEKKGERTKSLGVVASGSFEHLLNVTGNGGLGTKDTSSVRYELLPPQELVASSGTLNRGATAFFKLKPTQQSSLEGAREFVLIFRVPAEWRADVMLARCSATGVDRNVIRQLDENGVSGSDRFVVALYLDGDKEAKQRAAAVAESERKLQSAAANHLAAIQKRAYPTVAHRLGVMLSLTEAKIPADWLHKVVEHPEEVQPHNLLRLPDPVRRAASEYVEASRQLHQWSGSSWSAAAKVVFPK
jgi:hypothetical protein